MAGTELARPKRYVVQDDIVSLMDFDAGRARAITIYADTRAHNGASRPMAEVVAALDAAESSLAGSAERVDAFRESRRRAEEVLADPAAHAGEGLAAFVCESRGLLEVFTLPTPFHTRVAVGRRWRVATPNRFRRRLGHRGRLKKPQTQLPTVRTSTGLTSSGPGPSASSSMPRQPKLNTGTFTSAEPSVPAVSSHGSPIPSLP